MTRASLDHRDRRILAGLALAVAALAAFLVPHDVKPLERGHDAGFTYGYLRSIVLEQDLDFSDDARPFDASMPHTAEGYTHNAFPIGPAVWWSPAFVAATAVAGVTGAEADGHSAPYEVLVVLAQLVVGLIGLWATFAACRVIVPRGAALIGTVAVWLAGPVLYYLHVNATQGHATGFAAAALLLLAWLRMRERPDPSLWRVAGLGLLGGLLVISRWQYVVLLVAPAVDVLVGRLRGVRRGRVDVHGAAVLAGSVLLAVLPQMVVWGTLYGSPLRPPRGEASGAFLDFDQLHLADVLLSWRHGMFSWHPILLVGLVGLVLGLRRRPFVMGSLLAVFVVTAVVNAGVLDWWGGVAFGARRFDGLWPALALGVAIVADRLPRAVAIAGTAALAVVNWALMSAFISHLIPQADPATPGDLLDVLGDVNWLRNVDDWGALKLAWITGLALLPILFVRQLVAHSATRHRTSAVVGLAAAAIVVIAVGVAATEPGKYDGNVFEAGYFVPQDVEPERTDRVVQPGEDVWTLVWAFPGFLPPGRYVAEPTGVEGDGELTVRLAGRPLTPGEPFDMDTGFHRLDLDVEGGPLRIEGVVIRPAA